MIRYTQGNLLDASTEAVVNTVNEVGVMGKGIALMFREAFPENTAAYQAACKRDEVRVGTMLVTENRDLHGPRWLINFPTKKHWRQPSRMEWITDGLKDLARVIAEKRIRSIALPPLGCGNGGLEWSQVRKEIETALGNLPDVAVAVYEPIAAYQNAPKRSGLEELTPARAMIAELVRRYWVLGIECTNLEVQKLAWFLQRTIETMGLKNPLGLKFQAHKYGPYSEQLRHLLDGLDGSYLHCARRLADASPYDPIWFEENRREALKTYLQSEEMRCYLPALEETARLIDGFESPLGMELLSSVDWLLSVAKVAPNAMALGNAIAGWAGGRAAAARKTRLFPAPLIALALGRLATGSA
jgi:O-acetyl-ADP-ribose deacetylase (regulator of RNase III)